MRITISMFAINTNKLSEILFSPTQELFDRVFENTIRNWHYDNEQSKLYRAILHRGVFDRWLHSDSVDEFIAYESVFVALREYAEPLDMSLLQGFKGWFYWDNTKLWPYFLKTRPPFRAPSCPTQIPAVGFLAKANMEEMISNEAPFDTSIPSECRLVRATTLETIESVLEDDLEVLAIVTYT
jgi:hypothetical protein